MSQVRVVLREALAVAVAGALIALIANAASPQGLRLGRNYFPATSSSAASGTVELRPARAEQQAASSESASEAAARRLEQQGLQLATTAEAAAWFRDPQHAAGLIVFIDARDDAHYRAGHIPGAWQFNHYRAEAHLPTVLPVCLTAMKVVVYCAGGECEDSEFAAVMLREAGVPRENLFVYAGGVAEWRANKLPLERGDRGSGDLLPSSP